MDCSMHDPLPALPGLPAMPLLPTSATPLLRSGRSLSMREDDLYFYQETIEAFLPGNRVRVAGHGEMLLLGGYSYLGLEGHPALRAGRHARRSSGTAPASRAAAARRHPGDPPPARSQNRRLQRHRSGDHLHQRLRRQHFGDRLGDRPPRHGDRRQAGPRHPARRLPASRAKLLRFRHNDVAHLDELLAGTDRRHRRLVVVDGVYSMDGDIAPLPAIVKVCRRHGALLMVDEAHSVGMLGQTGHGIEEHFGLPPGAVDIKMGTLSKAPCRPPAPTSPAAAS